MTAKAFRKMRKDKGYSQGALAREFDVNIMTVWRWEKGDLPVPRLAELALLSLKPRQKTKKGE
jgi:transcriptional regulator with XRE-family HTH domain